ncbi:DUF1648 domain-containing protein [Spirosoma taeanense]|uniref:DUF1648 domain-containing protein n=1 Tax=Spirosoma taeanense TaxID=2735870 RepID=A0A6M5Y4E1_9BACT|nr:SdpI family protein [Spirosoma taeanense]QJW89397.1 DUF1648 domain-containing protein [Spirosoma taeanense]
MKRNSFSLELLIVAPWLLVFAYMALSWNQLPARIVTHYDMQGNPDGWQRKETAALLAVGLGVLLYVLMRFLPRFDPKGRIQSSNYHKLRFVISFFLAAVFGGMWYVAGHPIDNQLVQTLLMALVGLMIAGIGNYLTTVKPNWFVGIRTPWTLESETVWRRTHQLGGRLMVAGGLLSTVLAFVIPMVYKIGVVVGIIVAVSIIPLVYSYVYFRQEKSRQFN